MCGFDGVRLGGGISGVVSFCGRRMRRCGNTVGGGPGVGIRSFVSGSSAGVD